MNMVLFLGAGFSKAFGLPVMREFYDVARSLATLTDEERGLVESLRKEARAATSMLAGDENNLEHLLSVSLMATDPEDDTYIRLCHVLRKVYRRLPESDPKSTFEGSFQTLIGGPSGARFPLTVITTNYDLFAEQAMYFNNRQALIPGSWVGREQSPAGSLYSRKEGETSIICKLHGSLNWYIKEGSEELQVEDGFCEVWTSFGPEGSRRFVPNSCAPEYNPTICPLIVPPTLYKSNRPKCLDDTWQKASEAIASADRIAFVGYSFPPSDTYMRYFLGKALLKNLSLNTIDIVDPEADTIIRGLKESPALGSTFKQRLRGFAAAWQESGYQITRVEGDADQSAYGDRGMMTL